MYSDAKALWHPERIAALQRGERIAPAQVQLIISDLCNHDCSFCAYRMSGYESNELFHENGNNNPNRRIETKKAIEIIDSCADMGVKAIQFTGGGEPTVHKAHMAIFAHALHRDLVCALVTNGQILGKGWEAVYPRFRWIRVSLDAGTAETHARIRGINERVFDRVLDNITYLAEADAAPGVSFIVTKENFREIPQAARAVADAGAHSIRIGAIFTPFGAGYYTPEMIDVASLGIIEAKNEIKVIDMFSQRMTASGEAPDYKRCVYQEFNSYIGADLNLYRCCNLAYNKRGAIGSLKGKKLEEVWSEFDPTDFDARGCRVCTYNAKNRLLNLAVSDPPTDLEFV